MYIGNQPSQVAFLTDSFSGNGSTTTYTMSVAPANTSSVLVAISGVLQDPSVYSVIGTTLTFSSAPPVGTANISVRYLGIPASGVTTTAYRTITEFTATANQKTFTPPSYTVGFINVYRNGVRLGSADYTASNGTTVVLVSGASLNDLVTIESFYVSSVIGAIPAVAGAVNSTYLLDGAVTQSKLGTNVAGNGPAFSAYLNTPQSIANATFTKVTFDTETFDTNNNFASSRFTPTVAGYYQFNYGVGLNVTAGNAGVYFYKNGSPIANGGYANGASQIGSYIWVNGACLCFLNGSTDYVEVYVYQAAGGAVNTSSGVNSVWFNGSMTRSA